MLITLKKQLPPADISSLMEQLKKKGLTSLLSWNDKQQPLLTVAAQNTGSKELAYWQQLPNVVKASPITREYILAGRQPNEQRLIIKCRKQSIGGKKLTIIAGPCAVESKSQIMDSARQVKAAGASMLRGGLFKPRSSPYAFQGLGETGLHYLHQAAREHNLLSVCEVMDTSQIDCMAQYIDILQVGARNMQNFSLLKKLGRVNNPILLKRAMSATYQEFLLAAEYIMQAGNTQVILCERGIRSFETHTRNTLDLAAVPALQTLSRLPVIVDPSHGVGVRQWVEPMCYAAIAAGCDGLIIEAHPQPDTALSDAKQTITPETLQTIIKKGDQLARLFNRHLQD